jgi:hypothetical protein
MEQPPPPSPPRPSSGSGSPPPSPLRSTRHIHIQTPGPSRQSPAPPGLSRQQSPQVNETGLITWIQNMREEISRENERFRANMLRENEIWKSRVERQFTEEVRKLVVEKALADNRPSSSSETSSLSILREQVTAASATSPIFVIPSVESSPAVSPISPISQIAGQTTPPAQTSEPAVAGPSSMPPPLPVRRSEQLEESPIAGSSTARPPARQRQILPAPFIPPRKPRLGSYYAAIVDTDGEDHDGSLLRSMIKIAINRPGCLQVHTGSPTDHSACCVIIYFTTIRNVSEWMQDVNAAHALDTQERERLESNSGELKRKRRMDVYIRICKVEAEDPWEIFQRR